MGSGLGIAGMSDPPSLHTLHVGGRSGRKRKEEDFYDRSGEENEEDILYFYTVSLQVVSDHY
ncbi:MAG TPA: hypothetical protein ENI62_08760 [Gammaproteobacteria bacterium]|nr:hypothetical protein [Gammaproteobacteria bacterium]